MNEHMKDLSLRIKEYFEVLLETVQINIWKRLHGKAFREKYKDSKLVNPDVIKINRDNSSVVSEEKEYNLTEEELQEIALGLQRKDREYKAQKNKSEER